MVLKHQPTVLIVAAATLLLTVVLYVVVPKGFFPVQDTGVIQGHLRSAPDDLIPGDGPAAAGARRCHPQRPGGGEPFHVHRRGRRQHHAEQRARPDQSQAARRAQDQRHGGDAPPRAGTGEGRGHHAVHAADPGPDGGGPRQPDAVPIYARRPRPGGTPHLDHEVHGQAQGAAAASRPGDRRAARRPAGVAGRGPPDGFAAGDHAGGGGQHALRRLRPAAGPDAVHPTEPVPPGPGNAAGLPEEPVQAAGHLRPFDDRRLGAAQRVQPF